jgi:hypothetical protein
MPQDINKTNINTGDVVFYWKIKEYEKYSRSKRWYLTASVISILLIVYAVFSANYLFALMIVLFGIILIIQEMKEPEELDFAICETGIVVGVKYYSFSELEKYWIIYSPPDIKYLYFELKGVIFHRLGVDLADANPNEVRAFLNQYLFEDLEREEEPFSDRIGRLLKLQ